MILLVADIRLYFFKRRFFELLVAPRFWGYRGYININIIISFFTFLFDGWLFVGYLLVICWLNCWLISWLLIVTI